MATINAYTTVSDFKTYVTASGQTMATDTTDDGVIEDLLERASRYIDGQTRRHFYPSVETRLYDIPEDVDDERMLMLDDDLLAVTTFTNGDATVIAATDYKLLPYNVMPKFAIRLKDSSDVTWETDTDGSPQACLSLLGTWGFHEDYTARAWTSTGTLGAAQTSTTSTSFTVTAGHSLQSTGGQIVKIDTELMQTTTSGSASMTVSARGDNGSTAATHDNGSTVYAWQVMEDVRGACLEIAANAYRRRFGENQSGQSITTPSGLVIGPADVTETARRTIDRLRRIV